MDKLKFVLLIVVFVSLIGFLGWGSWTFFRMLGFWQSAAVIWGVELFFTARGLHLLFGEARIHAEEAKALRLSREARIIPATNDDQKFLTSLSTRRLTKKFITLVFLFFLIDMGLFYFFGLWPCVVSWILIFQAFIVGCVYYLRGRIVSYHVELENQRLSLGRGEK